MNKYKRYTDEELINAYKELCKKVERTASLTDMKNNNFICNHRVIYNRFGSFREFQKKSGYTPNERGLGSLLKATYKTQEEIKNKLTEIYNDKGRRLSNTELNNIIGLSPSRIRTVLKIDSMDEVWGIIEKENGINKRTKERSSKWNRERVEKSIIGFIKEYNRFPTTFEFEYNRHYKKGELPSYPTFKKIFKGMTAKEVQEYIYSITKKESMK